MYAGHMNFFRSIKSIKSLHEYKSSIYWKLPSGTVWIYFLLNIDKAHEIMFTLTRAMCENNIDIPDKLLNTHLNVKLTWVQQIDFVCIV